MMAAPIAADFANRVKQTADDVPSKLKAFYDKVQYGDVMPPVGSQQLSYAKMMQLLRDRRVKRITIIGDGQLAMVEVPVEGFASMDDPQSTDRHDPT